MLPNVASSMINEFNATAESFRGKMFHGAV